MKYDGTVNKTFILACYFCTVFYKGHQEIAHNLGLKKIHLPAKLISVGKKSLMWRSPSHFAPFLSSMLPCTKPVLLTPPSHRVCLVPLSGQLYPPNTGSPPLSVQKMVNVSSQSLWMVGEVTCHQNNRWFTHGPRKNIDGNTVIVQYITLDSITLGSLSMQRF